MSPLKELPPEVTLQWHITNLFLLRSNVFSMLPAFAFARVYCFSNWSMTRKRSYLFAHIITPCRTTVQNSLQKTKDWGGFGLLYTSPTQWSGSFHRESRCCPEPQPSNRRRSPGPAHFGLKWVNPGQRSWGRQFWVTDWNFLLPFFVLCFFLSEDFKREKLELSAAELVQKSSQVFHPLLQMFQDQISHHWVKSNFFYTLLSNQLVKKMSIGWQL